MEQIPRKDREGLRGDYKDADINARTLMTALSGMIETIRPGELHPALADLLTGVETAIYRTANQILYHGISKPKEASDAFDELNMLLTIVTQSLAEPTVTSVSDYRDERVYELDISTVDIEHRTIKSADILLSNNNIAWNVRSDSPYENRSVTKAGIRLDYGPLYKEIDGSIDKAKTEWMASVDVSGHCIDKVMNVYSLRGHHFPGVFRYKAGILLPGLSKALRERYDRQRLEKQNDLP